MKTEKDKVRSVMVVGAGIKGCQAALDLADSGFKIYLIEKNPSIEETTVQLNKPFSIKDCATCIFVPKLVGVDKHPNIELITNADIISLEGKPGNFKATISKRTRNFVEDNNKGSAECIQQCSVQVPEELPFPQDTSLKVLIEERRIPPCENACPAHVNVQGYIALISKSRYQEAVNLIRERCPLPSVIGRICPPVCELACNRGEVDEPINICGLKRFVADYVRDNLEEDITFLEDKKEEKVAIIGSGPSGLTVAYHLARRGYPVTIFEKEPVAGGMLRFGIPDYRLPPEILDADIEYIKRYGVEIKTNTPIGPNLTFKDLDKEGYKAIFISIGLQNSRKMRIEGDDLRNVLLGVEFLKELNLSKKESNLKDKIVGVVGGGNVAMDAARLSLRLGAKKVIIIYRRSEQEMPASREEIEMAKEEGVEFQFLTNPVRVIGDNTEKISEIECIRMKLGELDASGRRRPIPIEGSEFKMKIDTLILAIGQVSDCSLIQVAAQDKLIINKWGYIQIDELTFETNIPGVFAGGEIVKGPGSAIEVIAIGNKAAIVIEKYLKDEVISNITETIPDYNEKGLVTIDDIEDLEKFHHQLRKNNILITPEERIKDFKEFIIGMDENTSLEEVKRCFNCGICSECFKNVHACVANPIDHEKTDDTISINIESVILSPGLAWLICYDLRKSTNYRWKVISPIAVIEEDKCIGCGECRDTCIFEAIEKVETVVEFEAIRDSLDSSITLTRYKSRVISDLCKGCGTCITICPVGAISLKYFSNQQLPIMTELNLK